MRCIVTSELDGTSVVVDVQDGTAQSGSTTVTCLPTETPGLFEAIVEGRSIPVMIWTDEIKGVQISFRGYTYSATVLEERLHALLGILQASPAARSRVVRITAPMPGLLKAVLTKEGAAVKKGESLFTLEAMKMENSIKAPISGIVHNVTDNGGAAVEKGTVLCVIEPAG
ncbi:MAG: biotin/lipoyl-binding protein [Candidatus Kapabacteria bacterium]|nr:biotin/lipoyl-binding protein [Candidatus Kapabacteria bacterium]